MTWATMLLLLCGLSTILGGLLGCSLTDHAYAMRSRRQAEVQRRLNDQISSIRRMNANSASLHPLSERRDPQGLSQAEVRANPSRRPDTAFTLRAGP